MATEQDIKHLFERYLAGKCSAEETTQLYRYFDIEANEALLTECVAKTLARTDEVPRAMLYLAEQIADRAGERLREKLDAEHPEKPRNIRRFSSWLPYAAAIVLALGVGIYFLDTRQQTSDIRLAAATIEPGGNRATLTLGNGRTIDLSEEQSGIVFGDDITYLDGSDVLEQKQLTQYYVLTTPKGGTYQITLSDGTTVWLNAASTLKYPSRFDGKERVVEISGEGYFAVAGDVRKPFRVEAVGQVVEVLGTEFNIAAYHDDQSVKTTLVDGAVSVKSTLSPQSDTNLKPGEQSVLLPEGTLKTVQVDTYAATAWRDGRLALTNVPFDELMRQLARWYNIDIVYQNEVPNIRFEGEITRDVTLEKVLKFLKGSGLQFEITNDRKLIVKDKKQ